MTKSNPILRWLEKLIALLALLNLLLVCFNLTYLSLRDYYLQMVPKLTQVYDPIKGIEPHPVTQYYLGQVNGFAQQVEQTGLESEASEVQLAKLRRLSQQLVQDDPFMGMGQRQVLAKIERSIADRAGQVFGLAGFEQFWSFDYLAEAGWQTELQFFDQELRPLLAANYYRDVNRYGKFVDRFWQIDLPFVIIFGLDILARTYAVSRRRPDLNWLEAILRRWYDWFLILPFWRWLRVIPVTIRLYRANVINLDLFKAQLNRDFAIGFAQEIIEAVGVQVIDQMQESVQKGDVTRWLLQPESRRPYVPVNNTNEVQAIAGRLIAVSVYDVLPQVQPDIAALLQHNFAKALNQAPAYQSLRRLPGANYLPERLTERLAQDLSQAICGGLVNVLDDSITTKLSAQLGKNFREALETELQKTQNLEPIQAWLVDLLEEIKINYVQTIALRDIESLIDETEQLRRRSTLPTPREQID
ncbi:MAG: hypothetical protein Kow00121_66340 [Elainellaceae cyanobacterium]